MERKRLVLFDFDGVIADTFRIAHSISQKMCVYLTESEYRKRFDGNIFDSDAAIRAADHGDRCDHALDWIAHYVPAFKTGARPFAQMPGLLQELSRHYALLIVSSTHDELIAHFLDAYKLRDCIEGMYGADVNTHKDEKFKMIFSKYGTLPRETVFVTDTLGDVNEAASVGLSSIGVTWGFQDRATLSRGNPFAIVDSPQELPATVEKYFASAAELEAKPPNLEV